MTIRTILDTTPALGRVVPTREAEKPAAPRRAPMEPQAVTETLGVQTRPEPAPPALGAPAPLIGAGTLSALFGVSGGEGTIRPTTDARLDFAVPGEGETVASVRAYRAAQAAVENAVAAAANPATRDIAAELYRVTTLGVVQQVPPALDPPPRLASFLALLGRPANQG